jgi:hypothetical protein
METPEFIFIKLLCVWIKRIQSQFGEGMKQWKLSERKLCLGQFNVVLELVEVCAL